MRDVQAARHGQLARAERQLARDHAGHIGFGLAGKGDPGRPEREGQHEEGREELLEEVDHASASTYRSWRRHIGERSRRPFSGWS